MALRLIIFLLLGVFSYSYPSFSSECHKRSAFQCGIKKKNVYKDRKKRDQYNNSKNTHPRKNTPSLKTDKKRNRHGEFRGSRHRFDNKKNQSSSHRKAKRTEYRFEDPLLSQEELITLFKVFGSPEDQNLREAFSFILSNESYLALKDDEVQHIEIALLFGVEAFLENDKISKYERFTDMNYFLHERYYYHPRLTALYSMTMKNKMGTQNNTKREIKKATEAFEGGEEWLRDFFPSLTPRDPSSSKNQSPEESDLNTEEKKEVISEKKTTRFKPLNPEAELFIPTPTIWVNGQAFPIYIDENSLPIYVDSYGNYCFFYCDNEPPLIKPKQIDWFHKRDDSYIALSPQIKETTSEVPILPEELDENSPQHSKAWEIVEGKNGKDHYLPLKEVKENNFSGTQKSFQNMALLSEKKLIKFIQNFYSMLLRMSTIFNNPITVISSRSWCPAKSGYTWCPDEFSPWCDFNKVKKPLLLEQEGSYEEDDDSTYPAYLQNSIDGILEDPGRSIIVYVPPPSTKDDSFPQDSLWSDDLVLQYFSNQHQGTTNKVTSWEDPLFDREHPQGTFCGFCNQWPPFELLYE